MKKYLKKLSLILVLATVFSACGGNAEVSENDESKNEISAEQSYEEISTVASAEEESGSTEEASEEASTGEFIPVIRFAVVSDTHISSAGSTEGTRLRKLFKTAYAYAAADKNHPTLDGVIFVGDMTNYGIKSEYDAFKSILKSSVKDETTVITVMGNHEFYGGGQSVYLENMDDTLDKHIEINGFHFIAISPSNGENYANSISWLEKEMAIAAEDDGEKPIFVFQHHHLQNTVYVSKTWYTSSSEQLDKIFSKYPQTVDFSGHSHGPINNPMSIWQGGYTCLGTGTLSYFEMEKGMTGGTIPENSEDAAQYYIIEVDANNKVKIQPYNLLTNDFFKTPSNTDSEDEQLVYYIDTPSDSSTFRYANRSQQSNAPYFGSDAEITVSDIEEKSCVLTIPQAYDDQCIYNYNIVFTQADGKKKSYSYFAEYYFEPLASTQSFYISGLKSGVEYTVDIYPVNCFDKQGEPISTKVTTLKSEDVIYTSENLVNFYGTFTNFDSMENISIADVNSSYDSSHKIQGDVFVGEFDTNVMKTNTEVTLEENAGYNGSKAIGISASSNGNQGLYIYATEENKNSTAFPETAYLRVWVDFSDVSFRKACFGVISQYGGLFDTDDADGRSDEYFWYLAEGSDKWVQYTHGEDGCFGEAQSSSVKGFKGWLAFPVSDFLYRSGTGSKTEQSGAMFHYSKISGVYMYWDYTDGSYANKKFILDEFQLVDDFRIFAKYGD